MPNPQKRKGDAAERELAQLLTELLGTPIRRQLGAGRQDDIGDLDGLPDHALQVAHRSALAQALRDKPLGAERQRINAGVPHAATFLRLRRIRGQPPADAWRVALTLPQWAELVRAAALRHEPDPAPSPLVRHPDPTDRAAPHDSAPGTLVLSRPMVGTTPLRLGFDSFG